MGQAGRPGKSLSVVSYLAEDQEREDALRADLLLAGLRFDDIGPRISYDDAYALLKALAYNPTSATYRVLHGHTWSQREVLMADTFDRIGQLAGVMVALRGGKPRKLDGYPRPKPLTKSANTTSTARGDALPIKEVLAWAAEHERPDDGKEPA